MANKEDKTRIQVDLTTTSMARLSELKETTEAASYAEVMRNALKIYDFLVNEAGQDARVIFNRKDGTAEMVKIFI